MKTEITPVMALNPYTDKLVNIEPVFKLFKDYSPEWADMELEGSVVMFLYELRDVFARLQECEISMPRKK
jgi:hypothetical protein